MNKTCGYRFLGISLMLVVSSSFLISMQQTPEDVIKASRNLTQKESDLIKVYLEKKMNLESPESSPDAKINEELRLDEIKQAFDRARYDLVLQQISALGDNPQVVLETSQLRTTMLAGKLEQTPWILREIAGLDWFFERDSKRSRSKQWPKLHNKLAYLISLSDELTKHHAKVFDTLLIRDAVDTLEKHIKQLAPRISKDTRLTEALTKLQKLRSKYSSKKYQASLNVSTPRKF